MSGGTTARFGFLFSDLLVIKRVLQHLVNVRIAEIEGGEPPPSPIFHVESAPSPSNTSSDGSPDWDILEERPGNPHIFILEEVKSGPLGAEARKALWKRLRQTAAELDQHGRFRLVPRLSTNADNPTTHEDRWIELPQTVSRITTISPPSAVTSAETLAHEALHYLTHVDAGEALSQALTPERARELIENFEFENTTSAITLEAEVEQLIGQLSFQLGVKEFCDALVGDLYRRAASTDPERHQFRIEDIRSSSAVLQHL
jgi:hypothetical protein